MKSSRVTLIVMILLLMAGVVSAATTAPTQKRRARPAHVLPEDASQRIDVNNISMVVKNTGSFAYDTENNSSGLEFPKGTGKTAVYAAGLWIGALVNGGVRVSVAEYSDDYAPGSAVGGVPDDKNKAEYKVYKLNRVYLTSTGAVDAATRDAVLADYSAGAVPHGAPPVTVQPDGSLNIVGDQMLWSVYNDLAKGSEHNAASSSLPLGIEIQETTFAFSRQGPLGNTVFLRYKIINRGTQTLTNAYVSQWSDPDLGGATDDLVGCDTTLSVGYVYNATITDEQYGAFSPSVGYDFLQGPRVAVGPGETVTLGLASFNKYVNGAGPQDSTETYSYMQGLQGDGTALVNPVTGLPTRFNVSGDPVMNTGWLDSNPGDRRLMLSSGPFTMAPGDSQEVVVGIVVAQGTSPIASLALMKCYDEAVQAAYDANFDLASPPNSPAVAITPRNGEVFIHWDAGSENYLEPPYTWEGYNVYQGASVAGPWKRIATYDRVDGITTVLDVECDPESPVPLQKVKAFGTDAGVRYSINMTDDKVRGGQLHTASTYFYAVTAYSVGIGQFQQVLESPFVPISVVPQTPPAGVDLATASATPVTETLSPGAPPGTLLSTDVVTVNVLDPARLVNASWKVGFKPDGAGVVWYLVRTAGAAVDTVINNWPNFGPDDNYQVVDGIQVKISSSPAGQLFDVAYVDTAGGTPAAIGGAIDRGLSFFGGAADYGAAYPGSALPAGGSYHNVTVRFGPPGQNAYHYIRGDVGDLIQDYVPVPFTVWDTDAGVQLNCAFRESDPGTGVWSPTTENNGGAQPIWVMNSPYTGVSNPETDPYFTDTSLQDMLNGTLDLRYHLYPRLTSAGAVADPGDKIMFKVSLPANANHVYSFTTTAPNALNTTLAKGELARVRAVPNPYFAHSSYELTRFSRVLKFTHLPASCKIRLFTLAGDLVRVIDKNDGTSEATWDLNTDRGLPVGSGIYIFHVDAPGVGTTTGKVAVFMEKERLNNF
jgi:hypothetical protein